jgi:hypothetical protein
LPRRAPSGKFAARNRNLSGSLSRRLDLGMANRKKANRKNDERNNTKSGGLKPTPKAGARQPFGVRALLKALGPGLITGASDDDPSGIGTYSQAGAQLGYGIGWTMLLTFPLMTAIQEISARVGRVHRPRHCRQCVPALFGAAAQCGGNAAVHRQHHQHRG